ncbi:MAG: hypothetical protein GYA36_18335 [Veillonellaceae bacterium]|nr:hypothetical protein [Veillonellaceae bacterium]
MKINLYKEIVGVMPIADVVEGRFGLLTSHSFSSNFGSDTDLPGFKVPATAEEAKRARFVITWSVDNREYPMIRPLPYSQFQLRQGFGNDATGTPFAGTMYLTNPSMTEGLTIPSGTKSLAFGHGVFTVPSGCYIDSDDIKIVGNPVIVANTAEDTTDAGKLKYQSTMDERVVGTVEHYDTSTGALQVRTL